MEYTHEIVLPDDHLPFKMFIFEGKDGSYVRDMHWHSSIEIFAVFEGELTFYLNHQECPLHAGEFLLVNSNEIHSIHAPTPNKTIVLQIPLNIFEEYFTDEQFILFSHSHKEQDKQFMSILDELYQTYLEKQTGYDFKVESQFYMLLYLMVSKYRKTTVNPDIIKSNKKLQHLSEITTYIRENYSNDLSLESLAQIFGYAPTYLSRMFQKYAGISYRDYLKSIRLEYAQRELMNTEDSISEIAVRNGFSDSRAFSKAFHKSYGVLPSKYRIDNQNNK